MLDVLTELIASAPRIGRMVLATIVSSDGSSPLPAGAMMLVKSKEGEIVGTVGGGLLEALVIEEAKQCFNADKSPKVSTLDLNDDVSNEGMICGGSVDVLLEQLDKADLTIFQEVMEARNGGVDCVLLRTIDDSRKTVDRVVCTSPNDGVAETVAKRTGVDAGIFADGIRHAWGKEDVRRMKTARGEIILQPILGLHELIIFGGGHVSKHLAQIASIAGFSTTVIDDREEFADAARFPGASHVLTSEYETAFSKIELKPSTFIVIVTRGHQSDELVLEKSVHAPVKYIGMIGSKRKVIATYKNLMARGISANDLKNVHAPIGLDIGAVTAEEIAVSIVAEMVRVRRDFKAPSHPMAIQLEDWFRKS